MIDLKRAEEEFIKYVSNYDITKPKINLKVEHIKRVEEVAKKIAQSLKLAEEQVKLAALIGLLHDIGRFEQLKRYNTFTDRNSIDHAEFGVELLWSEGLIRNFIEDSKYDEIIKKAIKNHNKYKIEERLSKEELLHAKIIRDADKVDILYTVKIEPFTTLYEIEDISNETISDDIYEDIINKKVGDYKKIKTNLDHWLVITQYIYDLNFDYSYHAIKNNIFECLNRIEYKNIETKERVENIKSIYKEYFKEKGCV